MGDPRHNGFNYAGWGSEKKPAIYELGLLLARELSQKAASISNDAWDFEMDVRRVRLATSTAEKVRAVEMLTAEIDRRFGVSVIHSLQMMEAAE